MEFLKSGPEEKLNSALTPINCSADQYIHDAGLGGERVDAIQIRLQRRGAQLVDGRLVHAGGVEIADLLLHGRALGIVNRRFFQNAAQDGAVVLVQLTERSQLV